MSRYWILSDEDPPREVECGVDVWAPWFETADRVIRRTTIEHRGRPVCLVSTVFLGLDHNYGPGPPLLYETMVFPSCADEDCERWSTWKDAITGHEAMVERWGKHAKERT